VRGGGQVKLTVLAASWRAIWQRRWLNALAHRLSSRHHIGPVAPVDGIVVVLRPDGIVGPYVVRLALRLVFVASHDEELTPCRGRAAAPTRTRQASPGSHPRFSYQYKVSETRSGDASKGCFVVEIKDSASSTNAAVSKLPAPIRNPPFETMKKPSKLHTHVEGWRPTVALAGHIVVPPLPVRAGWRGRSPLWM
jgi:hypothetical protein